MHKLPALLRTTRVLALGAAACLTLACSPKDEPQPSTTNNSPTTVNPATQNPPPATTESYSSAYSSEAGTTEETSTERGVGTVPPTTYSE
jgi:hypothetical protein